MKKLLLIALIIASVANANAQKAEGGDVKKNIVKLNLGGLIFRTASLQYERVLGKKISLAMGVRYSPMLGLPSGIKSKASSGASPDRLYTIDNTKFGGYAITPEFRFYPGKKGAAKGFYLAPYFRYAAYNLSVPLQYTQVDSAKNNSSTVYHYELIGKASYISGGLMMGAQWIAKGGFTFDWWIAGLGFGPISMSANVNDPHLANLTDENKQEIQDNFANIKLPLIGSPGVTFNGNNIDILLKGSIPSFRGGICLGWAF